MGDGEISVSSPGAGTVNVQVVEGLRVNGMPCARTVEYNRALALIEGPARVAPAPSHINRTVIGGDIQNAVCKAQVIDYIQITGKGPGAGSVNSQVVEGLGIYGISCAGAVQYNRALALIEGPARVHPAPSHINRTVIGRDIQGRPVLNEKICNGNIPVKGEGLTLPYQEACACIQTQVPARDIIEDVGGQAAFGRQKGIVRHGSGIFVPRNDLIPINIQTRYGAPVREGYGVALDRIP